ncbi:hypothetical protein JCM18918_3480 [Cutibacterium acnes JCM 18918]|nr:hypothetical protein JCM18918_3480 [Cutibacterium acnes JCM 18918]
MGKKVTIKAGSLDEVDKRVAQALGNKSGSLKISPGQAKQSDPSSGATAAFVIPLSLTSQVSCSAICSRDAGDPVMVVTHPSQWWMRTLLRHRTRVRRALRSSGATRL